MVFEERKTSLSSGRREKKPTYEVSTRYSAKTGICVLDNKWRPCEEKGVSSQRKKGGRRGTLTVLFSIPKNNCETGPRRSNSRLRKKGRSRAPLEKKLHITYGLKEVLKGGQRDGVEQRKGPHRPGDLLIRKMEISGPTSKPGGSSGTACQEHIGHAIRGKKFKGSKHFNEELLGH